MRTPSKIMQHLENIGIATELKTGEGKNGPYTRIELATPAKDFMSVYIDCGMQGDDIASVNFKVFSRVGQPREGQSPEAHKTAQRNRENFYRDAYKGHVAVACMAAQSELPFNQVLAAVKSTLGGLPYPEIQRLQRTREAAAKQLPEGPPPAVGPTSGDEIVLVDAESEDWRRECFAYCDEHDEVDNDATDKLLEVVAQIFDSPAAALAAYEAQGDEWAAFTERAYHEIGGIIPVNCAGSIHFDRTAAAAAAEPTKPLPRPSPAAAMQI